MCLSTETVVRSPSGANPTSSLPLYHEVSDDEGDDCKATMIWNNEDSNKRDKSITSFFYNLLVEFIKRLERIKIRGRPLLAGAERVLSGELPAAESVKLFDIQPYQYVWYMIGGSLCDIVQLLLDVFVYRVLGVVDPSMCWALAFSMSVIVRHSSHRYLIFGPYKGGYYRSLMRMYMGYSIIIILSTSFNMVMTRAAMLPHYVAWVITLLWTGVVNFFILKKVWSFDGS